MVYMGSKRKYAKDIVPIIQKYINDNQIKIFVDCFCGGGNLIDKINCEQLIANDLSPTLIALHQQAQKDFNLIPTDSNREYWDEAYTNYKIMKKDFDNNKRKTFNVELSSMPLYKIGAIEWYGSFSNGGFPRGYAKPSAGRNYYQEAYRNHKKQSDNENYKKINFIQGDYKNIDFSSFDTNEILLYCDSPYKNTKPYAINNKFNFEEYYDWLKEISKQYPIFISEQTMPKEFNCIWEKEAKRTAGKDNNFKACEKLYFIDNRGNKNDK